MPRGAKPGQRQGGRTKGTLNKRTEARLRALAEAGRAVAAGEVAPEGEFSPEKAAAAAEVLTAPPRKRSKDILEDLVHLFMAMAGHHVPEGLPVPAGSKPDHEKFVTFARLAMEAADRHAKYQDPTFRAVAVAIAPAASPGAPAGLPAPGGNVVQLLDAAELAKVYQRRIKRVG